MAVIDARGFNLVPDISPAAQGVGGLISQQINRRLQRSALGGEGITPEEQNIARAKLASRDPRASLEIGSILSQEQEQAQETTAKSDEFKRRISKSFAAATSPEQKKAVLQSVIPTLQGRPGFEPLIADIQDDIDRFDREPQSVISEYVGASVLFDTQDQLKVGARKIFNDGTVLQSTPQGPRVFAPGGQSPLQGGEASAQLKSAFDNEIALAGGKAGAAKEAQVEATERQAIITQGLAARDLLKDTNQLLELNEAITTGKTAKARKFFGDLFGVTDPDLGQFNSLAGKLVLGQIRQLGANPTEGERQFLTQITPSLEQGGEVNKALLEDLKKMQQSQVERAKWFARPANRGKTIAEYFLETDTDDFEGKAAVSGGSASSQPQAIIEVDF